MKFVIIILFLTFELSGQNKITYLAKYESIARSIAKKYDISNWQYVLEAGSCLSDNGTNRFTKINNHFQIKCFSVRCKKGHCTNFNGDTHKDFYYIYNNPIDSYDAYCRLNRSKLRTNVPKERFTCH